MTALLILWLAAGAAPAAETNALATPAAPTAKPPEPAPLADPGVRAEQAGALYLAGDNDGAARGWRALVDEGWESVGLHFDLGNALLRLGFRGRAIASYQRALQLDPGDADAQANLEQARAQNVDRLVGEAQPPLHARVLARTPDGAALALFGISWTAFWLLLWLRSRSSRSARHWLSPAALLAALLAVGGGALLAGKSADRRTPWAVVIAPASPVREGPSRTLKTAFELHEGTTVRVLEAQGDVARIRLLNGLEGWVASADLEVI
jgi:tetratricopeptide (TPR) repeat protein